MFPLATKKAMAAVLAGAAIATSFGASAAPAAPARDDTAATPCPAPPPSLMAASAAGAYDRMRAHCATLASATQPVPAEASAPDGFDVPSAAIGAAAGTGLLVVLLAAGGIVRQGSQTRRRRPAST
jgi:hypothetical protein